MPDCRTIGGGGRVVGKDAGKCRDPWMTVKIGEGVEDKVELTEVGVVVGSELGDRR